MRVAWYSVATAPQRTETERWRKKGIPSRGASRRVGLARVGANMPNHSTKTAAQRSFPGQWLPFLAPFDAVFDASCTPPHCEPNATKSAPLFPPTYSPFHHFRGPKISRVQSGLSRPTHWVCQTRLPVQHHYMGVLLALKPFLECGSIWDLSDFSGRMEGRNSCVD
jgi:hypothetical protein